MHVHVPARPHRRATAAGLIVVILSASLVLTSCIQIGSSAHASSTSDPVVSWLRQHADRLATVEPGGSDADLQPLAAMVGNADIVGLGEATHGSHEIIDMKARLTEFLVTHLHFTTFVMENDWGYSHVVDAYINGGTQSLADMMQTALYTSWQTEEYGSLLTWMRAYNADPAHTIKLHFYGMDIQEVAQGDFDTVEGYVQSVDASQLAQVQQLYADIIATDLPYPPRTQPSAQTLQQYQHQAQQVYDLLSAHQQAYTGRSSASAFALALQNARIIVQFTTYMNEGGSNSLTSFLQRDAFMAENATWIYNHLATSAGAGTPPKMIVWAHDGHIANDTAYWSSLGGSAGARNMGALLRATYGPRYLPIGTAFDQGTITVFGRGNAYGDTVPAAGKDTYNYTLAQVGFSPYLIDLRTTPPGAVSDWANGNLTFLDYGLGGEDLSPSGPLKQWFDLLVFIRVSTPSRPGF